MFKRAGAALCLASLVAVGADAAVRKPMIEEFSNVQCPPCATHDPWFRAFFENHYDIRGDISVITYHMSWPGYDPFYANNPSENNERRFDYNVNAVPHIRFDSIEPPSYPYDPAVLEAAYNTAMVVPCEVGIELSGLWTAGSGSGTITIDITPEVDITAVEPEGLRLYVGLLERDVVWNGVGAYDLHDFVMRDMINPAGGEPVDPLTGGSPAQFNYFWAAADPDDLAGPAWDDSNFVIVAWLQDGDSGEIFNSESIAVTDLVTIAVNETVGASTPGLGQNYPNPFNPTTTIPLVMDESGQAVVRVYSADGSFVRTLANGVLPTGATSLRWDGNDFAGKAVGSGVYYVRLESLTHSETRAVTLLK